MRSVPGGANIPMLIASALRLAPLLHGPRTVESSYVRPHRASDPESTQAVFRHRPGSLRLSRCCDRGVRPCTRRTNQLLTPAFAYRRGTGKSGFVHVDLHSADGYASTSDGGDAEPACDPQRLLCVAARQCR